MTTDIAGLVERLRKSCVGHPHAKIMWPHRLLHEAADFIEHQATKIARLCPPHTPEGLHWLGDIGKEKHGCVAYFKDEVACTEFMKWLGERDDDARAALAETPAGLDQQGPRDSAG